MSLLAFIRRWLTSKETFQFTFIEIDGEEVYAKIVEENAHGQWLVRFEHPREYRRYVEKWVWPTEEQKRTRDGNAKR